MEKKGTSNIVLTNRNALSISGVRNVEGYDEVQMELDTEQGLLFVRGRGLKILGFDRERGELEVCGEVEGLLYGRREEKRKLLSRLFG